MSIAMSLAPVYPIPGREFKMQFSATSGNYVRLWLTSCPPESEWYPKFFGGEVTKVLAGESDVVREHPMTLDKPGVYTFTLEELTKGASNYGGGYDGDPDSFQTLTHVSDTTSQTIIVGQRMTVKVGAGPDTATLSLWLWNDTIRQTSTKYHGEVTPVLADWASEKARLAALYTNTVAAVAALIDQTTTTILGSPATAIDDLIDNFNAHRTQAGVHYANDGDNAINVSWKLGSSTSPDRLAASLGELETKLSRHLRNDKGDGTGPGSATSAYHQSADNLRTTVSDGPGDIRTTLMRLADLWRIYEAHRTSGATIHQTADTTNDPAVLPLLPLVYKVFFQQLATHTPVVPAGEQSGAAQLLALAGFEKS